MRALKRQLKFRVVGRKSRDRSRFDIGLLFLGVVSVEFRRIDVGIHILQLLSIYMTGFCIGDPHRYSHKEGCAHRCFADTTLPDSILSSFT